MHSSSSAKIEHGEDDDDMPSLGIIARALPQQPVPVDSAIDDDSGEVDEIDAMAECGNIVLIFVVDQNGVTDAENTELWAASVAGRKMKMRTYVVDEELLSSAALRASAVVLMPSYLSKLAQEDSSAAAVSEHVADLLKESDAEVFPSLEVLEPPELPIELNSDDVDVAHFARQIVPFEELRSSGVKITLGFGGRRAVSSVITASPSETTPISDLRRLASSPAVGTIIECTTEQPESSLTCDVSVSMEKLIQDDAARVALMPLESLRNWWVTGPLHILKTANPVSDPQPATCRARSSLPPVPCCC